MPKFQFYTTDVFTNKKFGGNQLAVFPNAKGISPKLYQAIAREFNFSETTFVLPPKDKKHTRLVKIFTPGGELQFAGHPTVGTAVVLASIGAVKMKGKETKIVLEEGVGPVPVTIRATKGKPDFAQLTAAKVPEYGPPPPPASELAKLLAIDASDIRTDDWFPEAASCGTQFLFVPLKSRAAVARAVCVTSEFDRVLGRYPTQKVFFFCNEVEQKGSDFHARMFAPGAGIAEDPATGSAAAAFAGYVGKRDPRRDGTLRWVIEQGFEMGRPSIIEVEADKSAGVITAARAGGNAVLVTRGELTI